MNEERKIYFLADSLRGGTGGGTLGNKVNSTGGVCDGAKTAGTGGLFNSTLPILFVGYTCIPFNKGDDTDLEATFGTPSLLRSVSLRSSGDSHFWATIRSLDPPLTDISSSPSSKKLELSQIKTTKNT